MNVSHAIHHDLPIKADITRVFAAVTEPEHLVNWWPKTCSGEPVEGAEYNFHFGPEYDWYGRVAVCAPPTTFHVKMTRSDEDWDPTTFGFDLKASKDASTQVRFLHTGWPACNDHFRRSSYCWAILLKGLKDYVERGIIVPFEKRE